MCDYSLHGIENRLAVEGEILVVHRFYTGSKGLTSPSYLQPPAQPKGFMSFLSARFVEPFDVCAVCIPDGAELVMTGISPAFQSTHGLFSTERVTFRQLTADEAAHRDAVEFRNGLKIRLQDLEDGQRMGVLSLSSEKANSQKERDHTFVVV